MPLLTRGLALTLLSLSALCAMAQKSLPHEQSIQVNVFTTPEAAETITSRDVQLLDNKQPRPIASLHRVGSAGDPVHVIVVLDAVNIPYIRMAYEREEIEKYFKANGGKLSNPTTFAVITDRSSEVQKGFTTDGNGLSALLETYPIGLREVRRDQGIWGADERTQISLKALSELTEFAASIPGQKMVLWVSPGWPLLTGIRIDLTNAQHQGIFRSVVDYSRQLRLAKVTLYNINPIGPEEDLLRANYYEDFVKGITKSQNTDIADLSLQVLAVQSGGQTITGNSDVTGNLAKCVAEARSMYELTFTPAPAEHADEFHPLQVTIAKTGVTARARNGYYAQP
ncbi:VWA domain-containing protein [Terriglobus roseus]|uniref:VWFA-related domain-containing protein n=1 Tax=Terriglobus roseus TaxID=392734 RepID=A0A1H4LBM4_9BACT|nr:VWA domain-containing protein [Terriglobus roseus]SEB67582.1 VWFA-related domain-containing protein [Terriglobus roseus]